MLEGLGSPDDPNTIIGGISKIQTETAESIPDLEMALDVLNGSLPNAIKILAAKEALEQVLHSLANDDPTDPGLLLATAMLLAGLEEIDGGLNEMKTGIDDQMVPGLEEICWFRQYDPETLVLARV